MLPKLNENEIKPLTEFIANIDATLPVCFLASRPNFVLENHPGAAMSLMEKCVNIAKEAGLKNAYWSGYTGIAGTVVEIERKIEGKYTTADARLAGSYSFQAGCQTHPRNCSKCNANQACRIKKYIPKLVT